MEKFISIDLTYVGRVLAGVPAFIGEPDCYSDCMYYSELYMDNSGNYYQVDGDYGELVPHNELKYVLCDAEFTDAYFTHIHAQRIGMICTGHHMEGNPEDYWMEPEYNQDLYMDIHGNYYAVFRLDEVYKAVRMLDYDEWKVAIRDGILFLEFRPIIFDEPAITCLDDDLPF